MKKQQSGFSAVEVVIAIVIVGLVGVAGWLVYEDHHKTTTPVVLTKQKTTSSTKATPAVDNTKTTSTQLPTGAISKTGITGSYTYPNQYFSIAYPSEWVPAEVSIPPTASQPGILSTIVTITSPNAAQAETASITVYKAITLSNALSYAFQGNGTSVENSQSLTINGYSAMYQQNVISGSGSYTDDSYAVTNNHYTVVFSFRVSQTYNGEVVFNATNLLPDFNAIVTSIKFNN